jgi:hypothetical protein
MCHHRYWHHSPICIKPGLGLGTSLGILVQSVRRLAPGSSDPSGIEPVTFYYFGPSKKPRQRDFLLLTLTKLGSR